MRSAPWDIGPRPPRGESPWDSDLAEGTTEPSPKGFARALTPPPGLKRRASTPVPLRVGGGDLQTPTDPEIETYLELEADLPPEPGAADPDLETELVLSLALGGDRDDEHESVSITIEEEGRRVIETTTESEGHTLTVTVTEPYDSDDRRAITAEDGAEVSGTISIPEDTPPPPALRRRARRQSDGWDD